MSVFEKSQWIWLRLGEAADQYAEFQDRVVWTGGETEIRLSCDTDYTLFVNGVYVASGQYGDFEHYKIYDTVALSPFLNRGENTIRILVHHVGVATSRYRPAKAGLIYEILSGETLLAVSREQTLSRLSPTYESGNGILVSPQLGFTFTYDATKETDGGYAPSAVVEKNCCLFPRPIPKMTVGERISQKSVKTHDKTHYLIDLGYEVVGFPTLELSTETEQTVTVAWGEHIADGGVRGTLGKRNFFYRYRAKVGRNVFTDYMLRLGCRYLEVFSEAPLTLSYAGLLPQVTEVEELPCEIEGELDRRIYDICVNTLRLCMMEHYVDCPWREQAFYAFDSRNQMLCGYDVFAGGNAAYARANLKLMGEDRRADGLLSICVPCGSPTAIPSFSLYFILAVKEYVAHTGDLALGEELLPKLMSLCQCFLDRERDGLMVSFDGEDHWNFYDWTSFLDDHPRQREAVADLAINCLTVIALDSIENICEKTKKPFPHGGKAEALRARIREEFLTDRGYTLRRGEEQYAVLGNALAILSGVAKGEEAKALCEKIVGGELLDCTLSMKSLEYEALLQTDSEAYKDFVLTEIRENYKKMLDAGSDTVWETVEGESAFHNAGSLCHGWSAVPVHFYHRLGLAKRR